MSSVLFAGTPAGVWAVSGGRGRVLEALKDQLITHLSASAKASTGGNGVQLACAVPAIGPLHKMYAMQDLKGLQSGLHAVNLDDLQDAADGPSFAACSSRYVWQGDARSCLSRDGMLAVGVEPADVRITWDSGASWQDADGFRSMPSRSSWTFPPEPHQPHTLSFEVLTPAAQPAGSSGGEAAPVQIIAGVEVGGVMVSSDGGKSWEERNNGLYPDVHACRVDPFDSSHWLTVTGAGLYVTNDAGTTWRKHGDWAGRYTVGLAFNPERQGEVMIAAGDRPPARGVHVYLSQDGGEKFEEITDVAFAGDNAQYKGSRTPVPYFWQGQALLGTDNGAVLAAADAARRDWGLLCRLQDPVLCMAAVDQSTSSIMH